MSTSQQNISNRSDDFADWVYVTRWSYLLWPLPVMTAIKVYKMTKKDRLNWISDKFAMMAWLMGVLSSIGILIGAYVFGAYVFVYWLGTKELTPNWSEKLFWISLINIALTTALGILSFIFGEKAKYSI